MYFTTRLFLATATGLCVARAVAFATPSTPNAAAAVALAAIRGSPTETDPNWVALIDTNAAIQSPVSQHNSYLYEICAPTTGSVESDSLKADLNYPCNAAIVLSGICTYGDAKGWIAYYQGNRPMPSGTTPMTPTQQQQCACDSDIFDQLHACGSCLARHGGGTIPLAYMQKDDLNHIALAYCSQSQDLQHGFQQMWHDYYNGAHMQDDVKSSLSEAKQTAFTDDLGRTKTALTLYSTATVTGTAALKVPAAFMTNVNDRQSNVQNKDGGGHKSPDDINNDDDPSDTRTANDHDKPAEASTATDEGKPTDTRTATGNHQPGDTQTLTGYNKPSKIKTTTTTEAEQISSSSMMSASSSSDIPDIPKANAKTKTTELPMSSSSSMPMSSSASSAHGKGNMTTKSHVHKNHTSPNMSSSVAAGAQVTLCAHVFGIIGAAAAFAML